MFNIRLGAFMLLAASMPVVLGVSPTDEYRDADEAQSSYLSNHNMDPNIVNSPSFGILWQKAYAGEKFYAKPLTFTSSKGLNNNKQVVILASVNNVLYIEDALSAGTRGTIASRTLEVPFTQADTDNCPDLGGPAGIVGTPVIDPVAEIMYFFNKGYYGSTQGTQNGAYRFHAIDLNSPTLKDVQGYPILVDGSRADNDPAIYFNGGVYLQRPSLLLKNGVVYGAFGSHCDKFNYTGAVIGINVAQAKVITYFSAEVTPWLPPNRLDYTQTSGQAGIWMGGSGLATDGSNRLFFTTGNGKMKQNAQGTAISGKARLDTLGECAINLAIADDGKLSLSDWFQPYDYAQYDNYDQDLGSAGITLLDPTVFKGAGVSRMALTYGKNNYMYVLNADNLGGFGLGPGGGDNIIQTINAGATTFGGSGSYPLDGGYIYFVPSGQPLQAYKLGFSKTGVPQFIFAGASKGAVNGRIGPPTVTSYKGQAGSGIVWVADNNAGLLAFSAVPDSNGIMQPIRLPATGGLNKFQRAAFGDGKVYTTNSNGVLFCMGSPVNLALNCTSPLDFGEVAYGQKVTGIVSCTALANIAAGLYMTIADPQFSATNASLPQGALTTGQTFSFTVAWDLTNSAPSDSNKPGLQTSSITLFMSAATTFSKTVPVGLSGVTVSEDAFVEVSPANIIMPPIIIGDATAGNGIAGNFILANGGQEDMQIIGYASSTNGGETLTNLTLNTTNPAYWNGGDGYNLEVASLPTIGSTMTSGTRFVVNIHLYAVNGGGTYNSALFVYTNGGAARVTYSGTASAAPRAELTVLTGEGGWDSDLNQVFAPLSALAGISAIKMMKVCNRGGSDLIVTKSKPVATQYFAADMLTAFPEGQIIPAGGCTYGNVTFTPGTSQVNLASFGVSGAFILNFNDPSFEGPKEMDFSGMVVPKQVGPLVGSSNMARYTNGGCYQDAKCGSTANLRCLARRMPAAGPNSVEGCVGICLNAGYPVAATQYKTECWCGNTVPSNQLILPTRCSYACPGDLTGGLERCGGDGILMNLFYDTTVFNSTQGGSTTSSSIISSTTSSTTSATTSISSTKTTTSTTSASFSSSSTTSSSAASTAITTITSSSTSTTSSSTTTTISTTSVSNVSTASSSSTRITVTISTSSTPIATNIYTALGCYSEPSGSRALQYRVIATDTLTVETCLQACPQYTYAGVEYGRECWCANVLNPAATLLAASKCNQPCKGNATEICGGSSVINVYARSNPNPNRALRRPRKG